MNTREIEPAPAEGWARKPVSIADLRIAAPNAVTHDDHDPAAALPSPSLADNDNGAAVEERGAKAAHRGAGRFEFLSSPFAFGLLLSFVWVAVVLFGNVFFGSLIRELLAAGGPIAIFSAMQFYHHANERLKERVGALNRERADAEKFDRLARLATQAQADLASLDAAIDRSIERSVALSKGVDGEIVRLEGACRDSEGMLAGLIQSAIEAELRAVSSHKLLQDAAAIESGKLQSLVGDVLTAFQVSGRSVVEDVKATVESARGQIESLFDRKTDDANRTFDSRVKQLSETLTGREEEYHSRLEKFRAKVGETYKTSTRIVLEAMGRASEAFSEQVVHDNEALMKVVETRAKEIRGSLRAQTTTMDDIALVVKGDIERSQKTVLDAFSKIEPSLSAAGSRVLDGVSTTVASNRAQIEESVAALLTNIERLQNELHSRLEAGMRDITGKIASSSGQIGVSFEVQRTEFVDLLTERVAAFKGELDESKRSIREFVAVTRPSLNEDVMVNLRAFEQNIQDQSKTVNSALFVRLSEIEMVLSQVSDRLLLKLNEAIENLKADLPAQTDALARQIEASSALAKSKAGEMAQTLEQSSSVFLEALEMRANDIDKAIVEGGSSLVVRFEDSARRLSEVMTDTTHRLDADFKRNSADTMSSLTEQADQIELRFNKAAQSAIDHLGSQIDFIMESLTNSVSRLDQVIRTDGGQLAKELSHYAEHSSTEVHVAVDQIKALFDGRAIDWSAHVSESTNVLVREVESKLQTFDGNVQQKLNDVFESIVRLTVRLQNGLDLKAGVLNEMLGRRASELSKIIGTMIEGYAHSEDTKK